MPFGSSSSVPHPYGLLRKNSGADNVGTADSRPLSERLKDYPRNIPYAAGIGAVDYSGFNTLVSDYSDAALSVPDGRILQYTGTTNVTFAGLGAGANGHFYDAVGNEYKFRTRLTASEVESIKAVGAWRNVDCHHDIGESIDVHGAHVVAANYGESGKSWRAVEAGVDATAIGTYRGWFDNEPYIYLDGNRQSIQCAKDGLGRFGAITALIKFEESGANEPCLLADYRDSSNKNLLVLTAAGVDLILSDNSSVNLYDVDIRGGAHEIVFSLSKRTGATVLIVDGVVKFHRNISNSLLPANTLKRGLVIGDNPAATLKGFAGHIKAKLWLQDFNLFECLRISNGKTPRSIPGRYGSVLSDPSPLVPGAAEVHRGKEVIDLYVIWGQSNAVGQATITSLLNPANIALYFNGYGRTEFTTDNRPYPTHESAYIYDATVQSFEQVKLKVNHWKGGILAGGGDPGGNDFGPEIGLFQHIINTGNRAVVIKRAQGGTDLLNDWEPAGTTNLYKQAYDELAQCIDDLLAIGFYPCVRLLLWAQGEADAKTGYTPATYYETKLNTLLGNVRALVASKAVTNSANVQEGLATTFPVVLVNPKIGPTKAATYPNIADVQTALANVASASEHVYLIDTSSDVDFPQVDDLHFNSIGQINISNYAAKVINEH